MRAKGPRSRLPPPAFSRSPSARDPAHVPFKAPERPSCAWKLDRRSQTPHRPPSHEQRQCRRHHELRLAPWHGRGGRKVYPQTGPGRSQVSPPPQSPDPSNTLPPSYLHINGFIHRDVKAANLLVDDDGTVLVGDLGVAAPLIDDSEQSVTHPIRSAAPNLKFDLPSRPKHSDNGIPLSRPRLGKRKSFVGTVRPCLPACGQHLHSLSL